MTISDRSIKPEPPFIWPEPRVLEGIRSYESEIPFEDLALKADSAFGIVTALSGYGIDHLGMWLEKKVGLQVKLIVSVYPTCSTKQDDIERLKELAARYHKQLEIRIRPYSWVTDRPTRVLCFVDNASVVADIVTGSSENLSFDPSPDGKVNFVFRADLALLESFQRYFTWLWAHSRDIRTDNLPEIPALVLPAGSVEAARRWDAFCHACLNEAQTPEAPPKTAQIEPETGESPLGSNEGQRVVPPEIAQIEPETGKVTLVSSEGKEVVPPGVAAGLPPFDPLADFVSRLYSKGELVTIDKLGRIPPLNAPLDPTLFGDATAIQRGNVTRRVSMRVSIIDEKTLKEIEKRRQALRGLLNKFSFGMADNVRWMPQSARPLFESEIKRVNEEGQKLVSDLLKGDVAAFIGKKRDSLVADLNAMYRELGQQGQVTEDVIDQVSKSLEERLTKAQAANFMPTLTYSPILFGNMSNTWANPWGQTYALLSDIAVFPRKALTDSFFFRGLRVSEDDLIEAMNVADDTLIRDRAVPRIKDRCSLELDLLARIEKSPIDPKDKCKFLWRVMTGCDAKTITAELEAQEKDKK